MGYLRPQDDYGQSRDQPSMRIAVVHNLVPGGARRRLTAHIERLSGEVIEICPETAAAITADPTVIPLRPVAPRVSRLLRPPLRFLDQAVLELGWRRATDAIRVARPDVLYLNPCQFLQAPPVLRAEVPPAVYFCDEPRLHHAEPEVREARNARTTWLYTPIYARACQLDRATTARASRVATNSRYTAAEIERVYGRQATVVALGVSEAFRRHAPIASEGRFLLSVGSLIPTKGHDLVLRAAAVAKGRPRVVVVASREGAGEDVRLRALARELGVEVTIRIGISDGALARLYAGAHATLYLAQHEPLGLAALEAQACGCPVVVAEEGGLPETIIDGVTGWRAPRDPARVASIVERLADSELRGRMSAAAREHGMSYTWDASAAHVERLLAEVGASEGLPVLRS